MRIAPFYRDKYQNLGILGKRNRKKIPERSGWRPCLRICGILGVGFVCACRSELSDMLQSGQVLSWYGLQGRWIGEVTPTVTSCGSPTEGLMTIGERGFAFDPFQSTAVVHGDVADDGHLKGKLVRAGPDHRDLSIAFDAVASTPDAIDGMLQSGRCRWTVELRRG
ncbi:MAG TPA: hypothetical protein VH855_17675 [Acetobacteraceae bacterium]